MRALSSTSSIVVLIASVELLIGLAVAGAVEDRTTREEPERAWKPAHRRLSEQMERMTTDLERAHAALTKRVQGRPELLQRLSPEPVKSLPRGYGILPEILEDSPDKPAGPPKETTYSIERLGAGVFPALRDASMLADRAPIELQQVEPLVAEYERLRDRMRVFDEHLAYHALWQDEVIDRRSYFEGQNRIVARLRSLLKSGDADPRIDQLSEVRSEIAPFRKTSGLVLERRDDGTRHLPVTVYTDIEDDHFLAEFRDSVESTFNGSAAARSARFELDLGLRRVSPATLYADALPSDAKAMDVDDHLARFPPGALVLTTGAEDTHAWTGRAVVLGPAPIARRTLAHEFGHLLGFDDFYLRGFDGDPSDPFGVIIVEWTGLVQGLMSGTSDGLVTVDMIERLIAAYSPAK